MPIGAETSDLEWLLRDLLRQGERKLIFDLAGVDQIDARAALFLMRAFSERGVLAENCDSPERAQMWLAHSERRCSIL